MTKTKDVVSRRYALLLAGTALVGLAPVKAHAQSAESSTVEAVGQGSGPADAAAGTAPVAQEASQEIVVTAQKRVERVQDVPLSITVVSQAQLERQQVNTLTDLSRVAPSLEVQSAPGQNVGGGGQIRGIGTQSFQAGAVASVGIVVDQVSQGNVNIGDLFDIARVEVLKGPQGTLFGLTTSAGVINISTNAPDPKAFSARARTELSNAGTAGSRFGRQLVQGVVNVPLSDNAAIRVSGNLNLTQGVDRNALEDFRYDRHRTYGGRARLLWKPLDRLTINLIGDYTRNDDDNTDFFTLIRASSADAQSATATCGYVARPGNQAYCSTTKAAQDTRTYGGSAQVDYDAGPFVLTSITAYRESTARPTPQSIFRLDPYPLSIVNGAQDVDTNLFTQEVRIASPAASRLEYTVGGFYSRSRAIQYPYTQSITLRLFGNTIPIATNLNPRNDVVDVQAAVFGQATYHLTDHLSLIGGARYTQESLELTQVYATSPDKRQATSPVNVSWKGGARYEFSRDFNVYGFVARGYKGPQVSTPLDPTIAASVVRPERPTSYEVGAKGSLFDRKLNFDLSAFYIKLKDFQGQSCQSGAAGTLVCTLTNVSQITSKGIEGSIFGQPLPGLSLNAGLIYNEAEFPGGYLDPNGASLSHAQITFAPKWKGTLSAQYDQHIGERFTAFVAGDAVYKSRIRYNTYADDDVFYKAHVLLGGRLGVRGPDDRWTASVFARNLLNKHEPVTIYPNFPGTGDLGAIYTTQSYRQVGLSFDARF